MSTPAPAAMACQELVELVTAYLENALSTADRERFEAHIARCDDCTRYLEQMRATIGALGRIPPESLSAEAERELLAAFRGWRTAR
jgi:anti-sigma factor RsiW